MEIAETDQLYARIRRIQGWLSPHAMRLFAILDDCQKRHSITGNLFEIGVWHGKSAIPLAKMLAEQESLGVCDIFDDLNAQGQSAKLLRFRENMSRFFEDTAFLHVYDKSSRQLTAREVTPNCRFIHIDGGHESNDVYLDLVLTEPCLHPQGAIVMDDTFEPRWPGVTDGIYRFLYHHPGKLVPLASGFKKLVLVRPGATAIYEEALHDSLVLKEFCAGSGPYCYKTEALVDQPTHVYFVQADVDIPFASKQVTQIARRLPWLRNPFTRWIKQKIQR